MPVAFTLHGLSAMPVDHPISLGMVGMHGTVEANRALMDADLIFSLGMRFDDRVTGNLKDFATNVEVIHVEIDPSEIDKNVKTSVALNADVGQHQMVLARFYNFQTANSWITSGGGGTMGCSLPMAIGVKLARPDERVWSVSGDGGFQMNIQELGTVMEHDIEIKILLMKNGYLGMVRQWQTLFYDGRFAGTPMQNPDYGAIAAAYGIPNKRVTDPASGYRH
jgi:thiamine pyrophosphate-dependent acetolactate synthase large subunit-like protein